MTFKPMTTSSVDNAGVQKTLLYGHHGWGKTTQAIHMQKYYGKGFIISGESGLRSVMNADIDYLPFQSWDGDNKPEENIYSFRGICKIMDTKEFKDQKYKWIMLDSLTELSDRLINHLEHEYRDSRNKLAMWGDNQRLMLGSIKWIRDLPYNVLVTALAKEEQNDNGEVDYWAMIKGSGVQKQLPAIFDNVLCGVRVTDGDRTEPTVERFVVCDEVRGWHGKVRDPHRKIEPVMRTSNLTEIFDLMKDKTKNKKEAA
tara:strand:- start:1639 stop:2409 length:771 start_codon:yes stop_codon:yes gene_type:complete